jgi:serine/threonine-protein kinase
MVARVYLGRYEVVRELGEGGMGKVYLGRSLSDGRQVVIKVMHGHLAADPRFRQGFCREMKLMTRFRHPNAVAFYEASVDDPQHPCIVMEYVPGISLETLVEREGRLSPERVGRFLGQLCLVLHAAHGAGILHRDLTCANLMIVDAGRPHEKIKVMDFGLARMGAGGFYIPFEKLTGSSRGIGGGTPDYVCPEQIRGDEVDQRGDLYSVGVVLFKLLTGHLPFEGVDSVDDILLCHLQRNPPRFSELGVQDVPSAIEAVVQDLLAKHPEDRPPDAETLAGVYASALGQPIVDESFERTLAEPEPDVDGSTFDPHSVLDQLQAWMPERIAIMKLRGFIEDVGGEVVDSEPGLIRVRLLDPRGSRTVASAGKGGILSLLGLGRKVLADPSFLVLELHMMKKEVEPKNLLEVTVVLPPEKETNLEDEAMRRGFGERICRELRAYLMCR